ncbi:hypothetical protein HBB16_01465 [Pseudonocardia sp. MCCB 268]|nr:hypothetical protein [Pseudonocardia cytotoxica]
MILCRPDDRRRGRARAGLRARLRIAADASGPSLRLMSAAGDPGAYDLIPLVAVQQELSVCGVRSLQRCLVTGRDHRRLGHKGIGRADRIMSRLTARTSPLRILRSRAGARRLGGECGPATRPGWTARCR